MSFFWGGGSFSEYDKYRLRRNAMKEVNIHVFTFNIFSDVLLEINNVIN